MSDICRISQLQDVLQEIQHALRLRGSDVAPSSTM